jgi:molecular chaperone GrpE
MDEGIALQTEHRARLAARLLEWLDQALDDSAPPTGIAADILEQLDQDDEIFVGNGTPSADWYDVQAALTALTQETRLQSRAFARLSQHFEEEGAAPSSFIEPKERDVLMSTLATIRDRLDAMARRDEDRTGDDPLAGRKSVSLILDIRDRLLAAEQAAREALRTAEAALPAWWPARLFVRKSADAVLGGYRELLKGYLIAIERLDDTLAAGGISESVREGDGFDPSTMKIVDIEERPDVPEGTVLAVYRRGYRNNVGLLRAAEVKVARAIRV